MNSVSVLDYLMQQEVVTLLRLLSAGAVVMALVMLFRPLIVGVLRAGWLVLRPRMSREQRRARAQLLINKAS
jgi:hypothetical protein